MMPVTGSVWVEYPEDPGVPYNWKVYNYDTEEEIKDVVSMGIVVRVTQSTMVSLVRKKTPGAKPVVELYELREKPKPAVFFDVVLYDRTKPFPCTTKDARSLPKVCCDECGGSGTYTSPVTGKQSPCSRGCRGG